MWLFFARIVAIPLTDNQIKGIEKARATNEKNRTCKKCGLVVNNKNKLENGVCKYCCNKEISKNQRNEWLENKERYVILDTETTGLGYHDQIIEISIIDLNSNILMNKLILPTVEINEQAYEVHGMNLEFLKFNNAETFDKVYLEIKNILKNKIMLAYNASFDYRLLNQSCYAYNLEPLILQYEDIMQNAMIEYSSDRYIKLQNIVNGHQNHRALGDCLVCLEYINS